MHIGKESNIFAEIMRVVKKTAINLQENSVLTCFINYFLR